MILPSTVARARSNTVTFLENENARIYFNISRVHCSRLKNVRSRCYDKTYALLGCSAPCLKSRKQRELLVMWDDKTKNAARPQFSRRRERVREGGEGESGKKKMEKRHENVMKSFILRTSCVTIHPDCNLHNEILQTKTTIIFRMRMRT